MSSLIPQHYPVLIILAPFFGGLIVALAGSYRRSWAYPLTIFFNLIFVILTWGGLAHVVAEGSQRYALANWPAPFGIELVFDLLSAFIVTLIASIGTLVLVASRPMVRKELPERSVAFFSLALILEMGLCGMVLTGDLFNLYVFLEIASLAAYALMAIGHDRAPLAALRYLMIGAVAGSLYLLGVGFLYVMTGSLNMANVAEILSQETTSPALHISLALVVTGFGIKMALFPMHRWLPDAYTYASSTATALIGPLMTKVSAYALIRLIFFLYRTADPEMITPVTEAIAWLSCAGIIAGSLMAMAQRGFKRMLAYSSISQISYIGLGIGMATPLGLVGALLHILNHALMKACLFLAAGSVKQKTGDTNLEHLTGLGRRMPWTGFCITVAALAMVGIPPTVGFFSKWYLVLAALEAGRWFFVFVILGSSLLTAVYMFKLIELLYTRPTTKVTKIEAPWTLRLPQTALALSLLIVGFAANWLVVHILMKAVSVVS